MATRWSAGPNGLYNALTRGVVTSSQEDALHPTSRLYDGMPVAPARFTVDGQNDVLVDMNLAREVTVDVESEATVLASEELTLVAGTNLTIFNPRTRDYLQEDLTWDPASDTFDASGQKFLVQDEDRMQREWVTLQILTDDTSAFVIVPSLDSLTVHGHESLWQVSTAIQWHAGTSANPTGLVVEDAPKAHTQLLSASSTVRKQFHRVSFFGTLPYVGEALLCAMQEITRCTGSGRVIKRNFPQSRLSIPSGVVGSFAWAFREQRTWQGRLRGRTSDRDALHKLMHRASKGGADPMLFIPEEGVVMLGRPDDTFADATIGPINFDMGLTFEEAPLLLVEPA